MPRLHSGAAIDRPEITKLPPITEIVWQQPQETHLSDMYKKSTTNINNSSHTPEFKQENDVESQTTPIKENSTQVSGSDTESLLGNKTRSTPVQCLDDPKEEQHENQRKETDMTTRDIGDDKISSPKIRTSQIEERLVRNDITNGLYMTLSSTIVLKRKKEMLHVRLDFQNGLNVDALVDSAAYVSAIVQK